MILGDFVLVVSFFFVVGVLLLVFGVVWGVVWIVV